MYLSTCLYDSLAGLFHNVQPSSAFNQNLQIQKVGYAGESICPDRLIMNHYQKNVLPGYARMLNLCSTAVQSNQTTSPLTPTPRLPQNFTTWDIRAVDAEGKTQQLRSLGLTVPAIQKNLIGSPRSHLSNTSDTVPLFMAFQGTSGILSIQISD